MTPTISKVPVSKDLADTITKMKEHLRDEFGCNFSFLIYGGEQVISSSNIGGYRHQDIKPNPTKNNT